MHSPQCPPLPAESIDLNALHNAARQGHDMDKAIEEATAKPSESSPEETVPAAVDPALAAVPAETITEEAATDDDARASRASRPTR